MAKPIALAFTPDGRMLIASQAGKLRVYRNGALLATPALDLSNRACTDSERGLLGVAVDPNFASNRYIYLYYTFKKYGVCERNTELSPVNRVSRFRLPDSNVVNPGSELVLIDNIPSPNGSHNAGDLFFGKNGYLYVSVGDGGCDYANDSGCAAENDAARDQHVLLGKILRITRSGGIPSASSPPTWAPMASWPWPSVRIRGARRSITPPTSTTGRCGGSPIPDPSAIADCRL